MPQDEQTARAMSVQKKYEHDLMQKKHVVGVAVGLAKKAGQSTDEIALVVLVEKKIEPDELDAEDLIPAQLDGLRVDVQQVGIISARP